MHFDKQFLILFTITDFFKVALINLIAIFILWGKLATARVLKITVLSNKGYDVLI